MKRESLSQLLERLEACDDARAWAKGKPRKRAWETCERGDWMIWLLAHDQAVHDDRLLRLLACDIAETVLHLVPPGEDRPRLAIEAARGFANGTASGRDLAAARAAARAAALAARAAARAAALAAALAARAAARAAALAAAWDASNKQHADLVRKWFPEFPALRGEGDR